MTQGWRPSRVAAWMIATAIAASLFSFQEASAQNTGVRRALLICGLSGNEEFHEQHVESMSQIRTALKGRFGFAAADIHIQFGRREDEPPVKGFPKAGRATRKEIELAVKQLSEVCEDEDTSWIFVIGHAYFDGKNSFFNIPDQDMSHAEFSALFARLKGRSTFFICTPASGYYVRELSQPNRVVVTATDADFETNASLFHSALAQAMTTFSQQQPIDIDKDGAVSVLDLYIQANRNLADLYLKNDPPLIATEHPLLDDNGDRRGSELQIDYLTIEQGGRSDAKRKRNIRKFADGEVAASRPLMRTPP